MSVERLFDLKGKVAIVTGGNGGIGLGIARGLAGAGANIVVAARNTQKTEQAELELKSLGVDVLGLTVDVTQESEIQRMVADAKHNFGRVDILVNNAGTVVRKTPDQTTTEEWDRVLNVNLRAAFLASREVYPHMVQQGGGKIIGIGSMYSIFGGGGSGAPYSASKGGVVQLAKSLAVAWAKNNIQSNAILPGWFMTELTSDIPTQQPERYRMISSRIPTGRWGEVDELQGAAVFLASAASDYITGAVLTVDGGYSVM